MTNSNGLGQPGVRTHSHTRARTHICNTKVYLLYFYTFVYNIVGYHRIKKLKNKSL